MAKQWAARGLTLDATLEGIRRTLTGTKMELPVRKLLLGAPPEEVANPDAMANPESFAYFVRFASDLNRSVKAAI